MLGADKMLSCTRGLDGRALNDLFGAWGHIGRGNVAWIEDVFVKEEFRNRGIATESIRQAEEIIKATPPYNAICFDVVPRNVDALKLYHKLGYQTLSLITVRKNLVPKESSGTQKINGLEFKI